MYAGSDTVQENYNNLCLSYTLHHNQSQINFYDSLT